MNWPTLLACFLLPLVASLGLTFLLLVVLRRIGLYDRPNERSLHDTPTPRGGGLAPATVLVAGIAAVAGAAGLPQASWLPVLGGAVLLAERRLATESFFAPAPIRQAWREHLSGRYNNQYPLWDVLMFQAWHAERQRGAAALAA